MVASAGVRGHWLALALAATALLGTDPGFEASSLRASQLLPPELLRGPHHRVEEAVASDGFLPLFRGSSDFGPFEARGLEALRERVREIEALAALRATGPLTLGGTGGRFVDLDGMKRSVAARLGIDPYTPNQALQRELQQQVWAAYAGRGASPPQAPAEPAQEADRSEALVRDYSAEDLRRLQRIELAVMGVDEELREQFLDNPYYTSLHGARLLDSLSALEGTSDRSAFIELAAGAGSDEEARDFELLAELMRRYRDETGSFERFVSVGGHVAATTADGTLLVPVLGEHATWTRGVASFAESLARAAGEDPEVTRTRLLFSGSLSERARREMERLGLAVSDDELE